MTSNVSVVKSRRLRWAMAIVRNEKDVLVL
jgi:hypothetical protein